MLFVKHVVTKENVYALGEPRAMDVEDVQLEPSVLCHVILRATRRTNAARALVFHP